MHHEWECPDCGEELYHECETEAPQGDSGVFRIDLGDAITRRAAGHEGFTEAPFCQIDPDNRPSPFIRRYAERDILRVIADRIENEQGKAENPRCERECTEHPAHLWDGTPVPQGKATGEPCNCLGFSHSKDCPNWELPH